MHANPVLGSRAWMCTIAAPALAASSAEVAICSGVTGTAGFLPTESADPVTAQEIMTLRTVASRFALVEESLAWRTAARYGPQCIGRARTLHPLVRCAKPCGARPWNESELTKR